MEYRHIGEITLYSSKQHKYINTYTYYFTRLVEVVPLRQVNYKDVIRFINQNIITSFEVPTPLIFDNATYFL